MSSGVRDIVGVDEYGIIHRGRAKGMDFMKRSVATTTNPRGLRGRLAEAEQSHRGMGAAHVLHAGDRVVRAAVIHDDHLVGVAAALEVRHDLVEIRRQPAGFVEGGDDD